jgi:hypothetical protein
MLALFGWFVCMVLDAPWWLFVIGFLCLIIDSNGGWK